MTEQEHINKLADEFLDAFYRLSPGTCICGNTAKRAKGINRQVHAMPIRGSVLSICSTCIAMLGKFIWQHHPEIDVRTWQLHHGLRCLDDIPDNVFSEWLARKLLGTANARRRTETST